MPDNRKRNYVNKRAVKDSKQKEFLDPNNVSPSGNRSTSEFLKDKKFAAQMASLDYDASTKYDWAINKVTKPSRGAHFRSIQNSYSTTSSHERKKK